MTLKGSEGNWLHTCNEFRSRYFRFGYFQSPPIAFEQLNFNLPEDNAVKAKVAV
jgi:hypothetical protein